MVAVFVTGSSAGIGQAGASALVGQGHRVVLHARSAGRAEQALAAVPGAAGVAVGDLASFASTRELAEQAAALGPFDTVVHNAGIGRMREPTRAVTVDGNESTLQVNVLSAYLLTALMPRPARLVYTSSALAGEGVLDLADPHFARRPWNGREVYATTKLLLVMLAQALAARWPGTACNSFDPGFVRTNMTVANGDIAPQDATRAGERMAWLAAADEPAATATGEYFTERSWRPPAYSQEVLTDLLGFLAKETGTPLP